jgi:PAS domain S-box-containing protein
VSAPTPGLGEEDAPGDAAFAHAALGMALAGLDGRILRANAAFARTTGRDADALHGMPVAGLAHPDDAKPIEALLLGAAAGGEGVPATEARCVRPGGGLRRVALSATPLRDAAGRPRRLLVQMLDLTERRAAEEGLRRLAAIVGSTGDAILTVDPEGLVTNWNPAAERIFGYAAAEMVGQPLRRLLPPERAHEMGDVARVLAGQTVRHHETERLRRDGARVHVSVSLAPLRDPEGRTLGVSSIVRDVTERRELEDARRQLAHSEKLSALGTLVLGVGHEIKTPLTFIATHLYHVQRRLDDLRPAAPGAVDGLLPHVQEALEGVDRINQLVLELRRFTRTQPGARVHAPLDEAVAGALRIFRATHRGVAQPEEDLAAPRPLALDLIQLQQVVLNLLENAAEAVPPGGRIQVRTRDAGDHAELAVSDEGPGIPPEVQARMFEAFYTTKAHGSGLGLSIVRRIVEAHGGSVSCETGPGRGTAFRVLLPYRRASSAR